MPDFPGFILTKAGISLREKCEAGAVLEYTAARLGSGKLPPGGSAFSALAVTGIVTVYNNERGQASDAEDINTGFTISTELQGVPDTAEVTNITPVAASELSAGDYFKLHTPFLDYHVWYRINGIGVDPELAGSIGIVVDLESLDSAIVVASKTAQAIDQDRTEVSDLVRLIKHEMDAGITAVEKLGNGTTRLPIQFDNRDLEQGFAWRETGIYANDPDKGEILYSVTNSGDLSDPVPAQGGSTIVEYNMDAITKIGSIQDVQAITVPSSTYVTNEIFNAHQTDKKAHGRTWSVIDSDYTAVSGDRLHIDTALGVVPVTVPDNPVVDDYVIFNDFSKTWDIKKLRVCRAPTGEKIQGLNEDMDVDTKGLDFGLVYTGILKGWVII